MNSVSTLIKWPGGKAREIKYIESLIPEFDRYVEPFFGGGAMYFYLHPQRAIINDISNNLTSFYKLAKEQNKKFYSYLCDYDLLLKGLINYCDNNYDTIRSIYTNAKNCNFSKMDTNMAVSGMSLEMLTQLPISSFDHLVLDKQCFREEIILNVIDKINRTIKNENKATFSEEDLRENLITGFVSGLYMYFRSIYNDILLKRRKTPNQEYNIANFYFIREYCYGSMFRYNRKGEFNIPYGGMSYNRKSFKSKIDNIFSNETSNRFEDTDIYCKDFEDFLSTVKLTKDDFMFLDPPYDTDFSDYEGKDFTKNDQRRLADSLKKTKAKFVLIIKNTDYIYSLYKNHFNIYCFDKTYTYNVRSRNERNVEHLIITNIQSPVTVSAV